MGPQRKSLPLEPTEEIWCMTDLSTMIVISEKLKRT